MRKKSNKRKTLNAINIKFNKNILIVVIGIILLEVLSISFNNVARYAIDHWYDGYNLSWLYNPWTNDMGFVGTPSLIAVLLASFIIGFISRNKGIINATLAGTLNGSFWALVNVLPYSPIFMTQSYILAMLQTIPYYLVVSFIGGYIGQQFNKQLFSYKE